MKKSSAKDPDLAVHESSGNVFADLGLPNFETLLAKSELAHQINRIIRARSLTQAEAAKLLHTSQGKVSNLSRGILTGFSIDRLFRLLNALDRDVVITIKRKPRSRSRSRVSVNTAP